MPPLLPLDRRDVDLVVFDFDGVLTDNRVLVFADGAEAVFCNRADGLAFDALRRHGIKVLILSTERHPVVQARAAKLGVPAVVDCKDKAAAIAAICAEHDARPERIMYVGNDVNDIGAMRQVGISIAVADAHAAVVKAASHVLLTRGGEGVAREIVERVFGLDVIG
ncbi:MAG: HAD hydrolase family protein [Proteobacteria bacterium]|nr:HAD hydrolase family protein [Pseudomonadota bacterium]